MASPGQPEPEAVPTRLTVIIGWSIEERPIECIILGDGCDVTLLLAAIHGDEPAGVPLLRRLADHLVENPTLLGGRRVILVPVANPDGFARRTRYNARGVDLNRNFPADNWRRGSHSGEFPLSEPESQALDDLLQWHQPHRVVSIHQPLACIDYDGPAELLAQIMSACCDLPVRKVGGLPGSLGSYTGIHLSRPIITMELRRSASFLGEEQLWERYGETLLAVVEFVDQRLARTGE